MLFPLLSAGELLSRLGCGGLGEGQQRDAFVFARTAWTTSHLQLLLPPELGGLQANQLHSKAPQLPSDRPDPPREGYGATCVNVTLLLVRFRL